MKVSKFLILMSCLFTFVGCSDESEPEIGCEGRRLYYNCRPPEEMMSAHGIKHSVFGDADYFVDLNLITTSALKPNPHYKDPQRYTIPGDLEVEKQISELLDPSNELTGHNPVIVEYRMVPCTAIHIMMYDADSVFVADLTDKARFLTKAYRSALGGNVIINSEKEVVGLIDEGTTISEYLAHKPMVFAEACFAFDDFDRNCLAKGFYFKTEIELQNGTILESVSQSLR